MTSASTATHIDPATVDLAADDPGDLARLVAKLSIEDPGLPARLAALTARRAREATRERRRRWRPSRRPLGHPRPRATALPPITDLG